MFISWYELMLSDGCCAIDGMWSSSVIKVVKMKYNRINIKWWLVSTSFKIYLDILSYMYITFTIFYYNTFSLTCTFFSVLVKGLYQQESYSLHVMQLIHIYTTEEYFYFPHLVVWGRYCACEILIANPFAACLDYFCFLDRQFRS